jgi:hypothetical protein
VVDGAVRGGGEVGDKKGMGKSGIRKYLSDTTICWGAQQGGTSFHFFDRLALPSLGTSCMPKFEVKSL